MRDRFTTLQAAWQAAERKEQDMRSTLASQYQSACYAPRGKRNQLDRLSAASSRKCDAFYAFLDTLSPRDWHSGIPCAWVREHLTYDDAVTTGRLSVTPPPAYAYDVTYCERFAASV